MVNGQFAVDMPRGTVTVLTKGSYAADGLKHCIRPIDMTGKSGVLLLRRIHPQNIADAVELDLDISTRLLERLDVSSSGSASSSDVVWAAYEHDREVSNICSKVLGDIVKVVAKKHNAGDKKRPPRNARQGPNTEAVVSSVMLRILRKVVKGDDARKRTNSRCVKGVLNSIVRAIERDSLRSERKIHRACRSILWRMINTLDDSKKYNIVFFDKILGLDLMALFRFNKSGCCTRTCTVSASSRCQINAGCKLHALNGRDVARASLQSIVTDVANATRPIVLTFAYTNHALVQRYDQHFCTEPRISSSRFQYS